MKTLAQYIPLPPGQSWMMVSDPLLSDLLGQVGYEVDGNKIIFTRDITQEGVSTVTIKLIVQDSSQWNDTTILPVSADLEAAVVQEAYQILRGRMPENKHIDPVVEKPV